MFEHANMLVLKTTRDCNLRCKYCYISNKDDFRGEVMDFELFKKIIDRIVLDRIKSNSLSELFALVFHGGEPLIIGKNNLRRMFDYAKTTFVNHDMAHRLSIQTNLTLLNKEIAEMFSRYDVQVGFSFDGISKNSNINRSKNLTDTFFSKKIELMDNCNARRGPLMVLNEANKEHVLKSLKYVKKHFNSNMKINYAEDVNAPEGEESEVSGEEFFNNAQKVIIDHFLKTGEMIESNIKNIVKNFLVSRIAEIRKTAAHGNCSVKVCGGGIRVVEVEPNGKAYYCGRYNKEYKESYIQEVTAKDFLSLNQINRYLDFVKAKHEVLLNTGCDTCRAEPVCDYGCMAFHMDKYGKWGIRTDLVCNIYKPLYDYLLKNENKLIKAYLEKVGNVMTSGMTIVGERQNPFVDYIFGLGYKIKLEPNSIVFYKSEKK